MQRKTSELRGKPEAAGGAGQPGPAAKNRKRGIRLEKRRVTIWIGGQPCSFLSDDPAEYISALEKRADAAMRQAAGNAVHAAVYLADRLLRAEQAEEPQKPEKPEKAEKPQKAERAGKPGKKDAVEKGQVTVWDLIEGRQPDSAE